MVDRLERLTNLLALLLETRQPLTLTQICQELAGQYPEGEEARRAAFERDKALLRAEGVPVETVVLSGDQAGATGYRVDRRRYELPDFGLTDDEKRALQVAMAAVRLGSAGGDEVLTKLGAADDDVTASVVASLPDVPVLADLHEAVRTRATVSFRYRGTPRTLDPYGLLTREGFWYVVGRDHGAGALRTYRADRIEGAVDVGEAGAFEVPAELDPATVLADPRTFGEGGPAEALVRIDRPRARSAAHELGDGAVVTWEADGSVVVRVPCRNLDAFRSWVLGFLDHAEVLEPAEVRRHVVGWLRRIAEGAS